MFARAGEGIARRAAPRPAPTSRAHASTASPTCATSGRAARSPSRMPDAAHEAGVRAAFEVAYKRAVRPHAAAVPPSSSWRCASRSRRRCRARGGKLELPRHAMGAKALKGHGGPCSSPTTDETVADTGLGPLRRSRPASRSKARRSSRKTKSTFIVGPDATARYCWPTDPSWRRPMFARMSCSSGAASVPLAHDHERAGRSRSGRA